MLPTLFANLDCVVVEVTNDKIMFFTLLSSTPTLGVLTLIFALTSDFRPIVCVPEISTFDTTRSPSAVVIFFLHRVPRIGFEPTTL